MGRDLQKKKRRSSRPTIRQPSSTHPKRLLNPLGSSIVAKNWNKDETVTQNYKRLGLVGRLKAPTGGAEPSLKPKKSAKATDPFAIHPTGNPEGVIREARVERDENGKIIRVLGHEGKQQKPNPLNDPLNGLDTDSEAEDENMEAGEDEQTEIVRQLEEEANRPVAKKVRGQSTREKEWLQTLIAQYGRHNTRGMARDRKLNPMQQTEADIARRIRKFTGEA